MRFPSRSKKRLGFESLQSRLLLTAATELGSAEGEGETFFVRQRGELIFVVGTEADNTVNLTLGDDKYEIVVDGETFEYEAADVSEILLAGTGGQDTLSISATPGQERGTIQSDSARLSNLEGDYVLRALMFEDIEIMGNGGEDHIAFFDSAGDDTAELRADSAMFSSAGTTTRVTGFERAEAFADNGGNDRVDFYDSAEDDRFNAKHGFSFMVGTDFWNYARGFDDVEAHYVTGGADQALFYDSPGDDHLVARTDEVTFNVGDAVHVAHNFPVSRAFAVDGNDTAELHGEPFTETILTAGPNSAYIRTTGVVHDEIDEFNRVIDAPVDAVPTAVVNLTSGFDRVEAFSASANSRAELRGGSGDDTFIALPEIAEFTIENGGEVEVNDFWIVRAFGNGGSNSATLMDSAGDDRYMSFRDYSFIKGDEIRYTNYVAGFQKVDAISTSGDDYAEAVGYRGMNEFLVFNGPMFFIHTLDGRSDRVIEFDRAVGDGEEQAALLVLETIEIGAFAIQGSHDNSVRPTDVQQASIEARAADAVIRYAVVEQDGDRQIVPGMR